VLRSLSATVPIVLLTSHDETSTRSRSASGADEYLDQDASIDYLIVRIEKPCSDASSGLPRPARMRIP